ncbi:MAG: NADH-quinone oxidoreductase subunit N [Bacteroidetes bacterium]|nr:NADH-quinone oxidoreductase subunit N [Bacteroidota bacterium]
MEYFSLNDLIGSSSLLSLCLFILLAILANAFVRKSERLVMMLAVVGILVSIGFSVSLFPLNQTAYSDMLLVGGYASFFQILFLLITLFTIFLSYPYLEKNHFHYGEYYILLMLSCLGMMLMGSAADLITIFLGLEVMSVSFYVLAGFFRNKLTSNEAALKYFLLGAFATGFLLYGIALIYGTTGTTNLLRIAMQYPQAFYEPIHVIGFGLLLIGLAFKVAAVPFHMWVPDVYEGAPTTVTGFMSTGGKAAAFASVVLALSIPLSTKDPHFTTVLAVLAAASMILGNWFGLAQKNLKRMLAYSSIAHAGYILVGVASASVLGQEGIAFYLVSYALTNLGAFGVIAMLEKENDGNLSYEDYAGLARRRPAVAALLSIFMFSLIGIPPFAGFVGKYYLFASAVQSHMTWLAILGVVTSLFSMYYYLRVVVFMYFREPGETAELTLDTSSMITIGISAAGVLLLGVLPSLILQFMQYMF